jgi:hypothetical protein
MLSSVPGRARPELAAWYGPAQFDTPEERMPAGHHILELDPPRLLVLRSDPMPELGIELHDLGGRTRMELVDWLYPDGFGHVEQGWNSSFDRLAETLSSRE